MGPLAGVLLLALAAYNYARVYRQETIHLRGSGRTASAASTQLAERIVTDVRAAGIELEIVPASNSREICASVENRLLDVGVVLGGFLPEHFPNVRQIASLGLEPLHLLVRGDLAPNGTPTIDLLKHRRVYIGDFGSNGATLAEDMLRFAGFRAKDGFGLGDFDPMYLKEHELLELVRGVERATATERSEKLAGLPDAVFLVASLPAPIVDGLVKAAGYRLVPLPYATALHLDARRTNRPAEGLLENSRIEPITIPAYTYGAAPAMPAKPCETVALRLLLVAHQDVPAASVKRLLTALNEGTFRDIHADLDFSAAVSEFPPHPGAAAYNDSLRPLSINDMIQSLTNASSMVGAFCAGAFALWSYFRGLRTVSPQHYLQQIDRIERLVRGVEMDVAAPTAPIELLNYLEARLAHLKQTVVEDYARGRLAGDDALIGILTLIADTRNLLIQSGQRQTRPNLSVIPDRYSKAA
jgi:TRAP-type uncharacterized transport system substrate-binding protein